MYASLYVCMQLHSHGPDCTTPTHPQHNSATRVFPPLLCPAPRPRQVSRQDKARQDKARQDKTRPDQTRRLLARPPARPPARYVSLAESEAMIQAMGG